MKKMKKLIGLVLALGMVSAIGFTSCGGDGGIVANGGVDTGTAKGEQVTFAQWTTAVTNTFTADNVTINAFENMHMEEVWDSGEHMVYEGTSEGVIKLAGKASYEIMTETYTVNGVLQERMVEEYSCVNDGMYCEWSRNGANKEWGYSECVYQNGMFDGTAGEIAFGNKYGLAWYITIYNQLEYDESTGEYSVYVEDEYDPFTLKCKIENDKVYTLTKRFEDTAETSPSEFGYIEYKYVFVDYGTTSVRLPNGEESGTDEDSEDSKTSSVVLPNTPTGVMTEEQWSAAFDATFGATNLLINGNITMETMGVRESGTEKVVFEEGKLYWEQNTVTGVYKGYYGMRYDESCGYEAPFKWEWNNDTSSWACEYSDIGIVDIEDVFTCLTCETYIDALHYAYDDAVYNSEKGCYVIDLGSWLSELMSGSTVKGTLEITFEDGLVAKIKVASEEEIIEGFTAIEEYEYVITYGNATVGELPPLE
ncbi:MAG: hypothetical protein E7352_05525 [Clostridiales bacterium]|nr:hypothetical protein [Clostridiales bacterium]